MLNVAHAVVLGDIASSNSSIFQDSKLVSIL